MKKKAHVLVLMLSFLGNLLIISATHAADSEPVQVKDIWSGPASGIDADYPDARFVNSNGILYFAADNGINGIELWRSDGTQTGTYMVKDINPAGNSFPVNLTNVNGVLFFSANDGVHGHELWKYDTNPPGQGSKHGCFINTLSNNDSLYPLRILFGLFFLLSIFLRALLISLGRPARRLSPLINSEG